MPARFVAAVVLAGTLLGACGSNDTPSDAAVAGTVTAPAPNTTVVDDPTPSALAFNVPLVGGGELDGSTLAGRPIAFWFWAPT